MISEKADGLSDSMGMYQLMRNLWDLKTIKSTNGQLKLFNQKLLPYKFYSLVRVLYTSVVY